MEEKNNKGFKVPDTIEEIIGQKKPIGHIEAFSKQHSEETEKAQKAHNKKYKSIIIGFYLSMLLGQFSIWGTALMGLYYKNPWLIWALAPWASGVIFGFGNLAIYYVRKNYMSNMAIPATGPYTGRIYDDGSIETDAPEEVQEVMRETADRMQQAKDEKIQKCLGNHANLFTGDYDKAKVKECLNCGFWTPCQTVTQERIMKKFYKETRRGDDWKDKGGFDDQQ